MWPPGHEFDMLELKYQTFQTVLSFLHGWHSGNLKNLAVELVYEWFFTISGYNYNYSLFEI